VVAGVIGLVRPQSTLKPRSSLWGISRSKGLFFDRARAFQKCVAAFSVGRGWAVSPRPPVRPKDIAGRRTFFSRRNPKRARRSRRDRPTTLSATLLFHLL
jgi:hypothetical protein